MRIEAWAHLTLYASDKSLLHPLIFKGKEIFALSSSQYTNDMWKYSMSLKTKINKQTKTLHTIVEATASPSHVALRTEWPSCWNENQGVTGPRSRARCLLWSYNYSPRRIEGGAACWKHALHKHCRQTRPTTYILQKSLWYQVSERAYFVEENICQLNV